MTKTHTLNYYPFGSSLPTRSWSDASRAYRYGFNGKEKDNETANDAYDFGARIYDGRLGRWMSVDPLFSEYFNISTFAMNLNCPILFFDPDGKSPLPSQLRRANKKAVEYQKQGYKTAIFYNIYTGNYEILLYQYVYHNKPFSVDEGICGKREVKSLEYSHKEVISRNPGDRIIDFLWRVDDKIAKLKGTARFKYGVIIEGEGTNTDQSKLESDGKSITIKWDDISFILALDRYRKNDLRNNGPENAEPTSNTRNKNLEKLEKITKTGEKMEEVKKLIADTLFKEDYVNNLYRDSFKHKKGYRYHKNAGEHKY